MQLTIATRSPGFLLVCWKSSPGVSHEVMSYPTQSVPGGGGGGEGVHPYKRVIGCAGWGRIFTTGLTITGSHMGIRH